MFRNRVRVELTYRRPRPEIQEAMWVIFRDFFRNDRKAFIARFTANTHYALYYTDDQLIGFTGLRLDLDKVDERKVFLIYFGQTLILPDFRNRRLITRTVLQLMWRYRKLLLRYPSYTWSNSAVQSNYLVFKHGDPAPGSHQPTMVQPQFDTIRDHLNNKYYCPGCPAGSGPITDPVLLTDQDDEPPNPDDRPGGGGTWSPTPPEQIRIASLRSRQLIGTVRRTLWHRAWLFSGYFLTDRTTSSLRQIIC